MELETNEKVLSMYRAVWALLDEGWDVHKMKVADITVRAGIGKGTAYEYFRSKEELVKKALQYEFGMQYQELTELVKAQDTLQQAIYSCFSWMESTTERRRFAMQALKRSESVFQAAAEEEPSQASGDSPVQCGISMVHDLLEYLVKLGQKEGKIRKDLSLRLASLQILSQLLAFLVYQELGNSVDPKEAARTKDFLYETIEKTLK